MNNLLTHQSEEQMENYLRLSRINKMLKQYRLPSQTDSKLCLSKSQLRFLFFTDMTSFSSGNIGDDSQEGDVDNDQVRPLTQFYLSFVLPVSGTVKASVFSTNTQSRFASIVLDSVLGPPCLAQNTWRCPFISVVLEATQEASPGPLKVLLSAKSPSMVQDGDKGVTGGTSKE